MHWLRSGMVWGCVLGLLLWCGGALFVWQTRRLVFEKFRSDLALQVDPPGAEPLAILQLNPADFGMELSPELFWRVQVSDLLIRFWWLGTAACAAIALGSGLLLERSGSRTGSGSAAISTAESG